MTNPELRKEIADILGLETDPTSQPDYLLIRDENDRVVEGIDFAEEVDKLLALFIRQHRQLIPEERRIDTVVRALSWKHRGWNACRQQMLDMLEGEDHD